MSGCIRCGTEDTGRFDPEISAKICVDCAKRLAPSPYAYGLGRTEAILELLIDKVLHENKADAQAEARRAAQRLAEVRAMIGAAQRSKEKNQ